MPSTAKLNGIFVPVVTPFAEDTPDLAENEAGRVGR